MIWSGQNEWKGETAVILAGGPSLRGFNPHSIAGRGARVMCINDSWKLYPWADAFYFCDTAWWRTNGEHSAYSIFTECAWVTGNWDFRDHPRVAALQFSGQEGFDPDTRYLRTGSNSGYQAIHLATHYGAARILLLGYDMRVTHRSHWHDEPRPDGFAQKIRDTFLPHFTARPVKLHRGKVVEAGLSLVEALAERGIQVLNCTPGSALTCWPIVEIEQALAGDSHAREKEGADSSQSNPTGTVHTESSGLTGQLAGSNSERETLPASTSVKSLSTPAT